MLYYIVFYYNILHHNLANYLYYVLNTILNYFNLCYVIFVEQN